MPIYLVTIVYDDQMLQKEGYLVKASDVGTAQLIVKNITQGEGAVTEAVVLDRMLDHMATMDCAAYMLFD
jgi:hypothetical protein